MERSEPYIQISGLRKKFGDFTALSDISLGVPEGSFTTLLGPSGCGKTTLLRLIAGFYEPDAGEIRIGGKELSRLPPNRRNTPLVFQDYALFPHMTVFENVAYGLRLAHLPRAQVGEKVRDMLRTFNLSGMEDRYPRQLSGGQQQRVAFARAMVLGQKVLLLDEPLSNLDAKLRLEVRGELKQLQRRFGVTMVYVTHDQEEALSMSDQVAVMNRGRLMQVGAPEDIYRNPAGRFVADFVGLANLIPCRILSDGEDAVVCAVGGARLRVPCRQQLPRGHYAAAEGPFLLLARPESVSLLPPAAARDENCTEGVVRGRSFLGRVTRYTVEACGMLLQADDPDSRFAAADGDPVALGFDSDRLRLLRDDAP